MSYVAHAYACTRSFFLSYRRARVRGWRVREVMVSARFYGAPIGAYRRPRRRFATPVVTRVRVRVHFVAAARMPGVRRANNYTCPIRSTKLFAIVPRVTCN